MKLLLCLLLSTCAWVPKAGQGPTPGPSPSTITPLGQIILTYNNQQAYWVNGITQWSLPAKGVVVNKIYAAQAQAEADQLDTTIPSADPKSVPLALLASESVLDPQCQNGNFTGSNPTKSPWGYDDGVAQLKLKYITIDGVSGPAAFATAGDAQAFAFDVTKAIPYFWGVYNSDLVDADKWIGGGGPSTIDPRLMNRWILAAVIYKQGPTNAYAIFEGGAWPTELNNFVSLETYFAGKLGQPSVFSQ